MKRGFQDSPLIGMIKGYEAATKIQVTHYQFGIRDAIVCKCKNCFGSKNVSNA